MKFILLLIIIIFTSCKTHQVCDAYGNLKSKAKHER